MFTSKQMVWPINRLAHIASCYDLDEFWIDEAPVIIKMVLYDDLCKSTLCLGAMFYQ